MKNYIIFVLMIFALLGLIYKSVNQESNDDTYQRCVSRCDDRGYNKKYCLARCSPSTEASDSGKPAQLSDQKCMANCKGANKDDAYCTKACTFY